MVTLQLTATLKDINGNPLAGKPINFYYSYDQETWSLIKTESTDENGKATTTFETSKTTYFKACFEGDEDYEASEASASYTVEVHFTIVSYPSRLTVAPSQAFTLKITVKNDGTKQGNVTAKLKDHNDNIIDSKTKTVDPGSSIDVELSATAPAQAGSYTWKVEAYNEETSTIDDEKTITIEVSMLYVVMQQLPSLLMLIIIIMLISMLVSLWSK